MPYTPSQQLLDAKDAYDKAISRYNDWTFNNKNLSPSCISGGKIPTATDVAQGKASISGTVATPVTQCDKEVAFVVSNVIPDLIKKYNAFKSLADADPNYSNYVKQQNLGKNITIAIVSVVILAAIGIGIYLYRKYR